MKKKKRTKEEKTQILSTKKIKVESSVKKTTKEIQRLKTRIVKRELEGLSTKFLEKILAKKQKGFRSIKRRLISIENELNVLTKSSWLDGLFIIANISQKNKIRKKFNYTINKIWYYD